MKNISSTRSFRFVRTRYSRATKRIGWARDKQDRTIGTMMVEFRNHPSRKNRIYCYPGVSRQDWVYFRQAARDNVYSFRDLKPVLDACEHVFLVRPVVRVVRSEIKPSSEGLI